MAKYESKTISELVEDIRDERILLPAIQRNFVWKEDKISALFDSIMHDYPIGTFLFWDIRGKDVNKYVFNTFINVYNEQTDIQRGDRKIDVEETASFIGVLDGQQRITSLYLGMCGTFKLHKKGTPWKKDSSYAEHYLCIDILNYPHSEDDSYNFALKEFREKDALGISEGDSFWVRVSRVMEKDFDSADFVDWIEEKFFGGSLHQEKRKEARNILNTLRERFNVKENVNYYMAKQTDLSEVVEIFTRVNSGGQYLSASDLILSIASGQDEQTDIYKKMQEAIEMISAATYSDETGFEADKDLILTAGLMFTGKSSLSLKRKENCSADCINTILNNWDGIIESISSAAKYIEDIGFDGKHLTSKNLILPVAYYFYKNKLDSSHARSENPRAVRDRVFIRQWLLRAMINSIFRDGIGTTLVNIRNIISVHTGDYFPLDKLMNPESKRSLIITSDTIEEIMRYKYGDGRVLPILIELTGYDPTLKRYQVDHIWANDNITKKSKLKQYLPEEKDRLLRDEFKKHSQFFPNLQLLDQNSNLSKLDKLYDEWIQEKHPDIENDKYFEDNMIPKDKTLFLFPKFLDFIAEREKLMEERIRAVFAPTFDEILKNHHLPI